MASAEGGAGKGGGSGGGSGRGGGAGHRLRTWGIDDGAREVGMTRRGSLHELMAARHAEAEGGLVGATAEGHATSARTGGRRGRRAAAPRGANRISSCRPLGHGRQRSRGERRGGEGGAGRVGLGARQADGRRGRREPGVQPLTAVLAEGQVRRVVFAASLANHFESDGTPPLPHESRFRARRAPSREISSGHEVSDARCGCEIVLESPHA